MRFCFAFIIVCACSAASLADDKPRQRVQELIRQLGSDDFALRDKAWQELVALGDGALAALRQALKNPDAEVARRAAACIAEIAENQKVAGLVLALQKDADPKRRARSAIELLELAPRGPGVVRALIKALDDPEPEVRVVAGSVLANIMPPVKEAVARMVEILKDAKESDELRASIAGDLARLEGCEDLVPILLDFIAAKSAVLRRGAASGLGDLGQKDPKVVPALLKALKDNDPRVRQGAVWSLGRLRKEPDLCVPALVEMLHSLNANRPKNDQRTHDPRRGVVNALGCFGPKSAPAVPLIVALVEDPATDVGFRRDAISVLGDIGPAAKVAIPILTKLLEEAIFKSHADEALAKIKDKTP